ncbi:MAG: aminoacyl-tRNA hydrolase [Lachnospiraceae bacterium]|nr:aminoacyl-tRNA hydrolase [Lachnospiraceae bacterium]MBQ9401970.1 aminoacyl-tRNA hydrolase [Clostridia bacterium]
METYLIAGLGNPDKKYEETRHNTGFRALDRLADKLHMSVTDRKFRGLFGSTITGGRKLMLLKPQTYMNLSGESVAEAARYYGIPEDHIIVLFDDINFACGRMRIRGSGSAGGHNGMKSIIAQLGSDAFPRVRIGVGAKMEQQDLAAHVLGKFAPEDRRVMDAVFDAAADAALCIIEHGVTEAMNRYNGLDLGAGEEGTKEPGSDV